MDADTATTPSTVRNGVTTWAGAGESCVQLAEVIRGIDAAARLPQSSYFQDVLRERRRHARDRQASLRC